MARRWVTLNDREQIRLMVLNRVLEDLCSRREAAEALKVSPRQLRRLLTAYRQGGANALAHGNRGRSPANSVPDPIRQRVLELARSAMRDINDCHFADLLATLPEPILLSRSSVRRILREAGLQSPQTRRAPKHRQRRERRPRAGMLLLLDASLHDWLQERGHRITLVGCIDDATNQVPYARFETAETTLGYVRLIHHVGTRCGLPEAVYVDRHSIFLNVKDTTLSIEEQIRGARSRPSQFASLLERLHIVCIHAHSPQAKGRIERLWRTFQDRLVVELRLAGASTIEQANAVLDRFLPAYNAKFTVPAADATIAFRAAPDELDQLCTLRWTRSVALDHTVHHERHTWQITPAPGERSYARCKVEVRQHLDGTFTLHYRDRALAFREGAPDPAQPRQAAPPDPAPAPADALRPRAPYKPDRNHPWNRFARAGDLQKRTFSLNR